MTAPSWDSPELQLASDSARTARYRLLQSWYRQHVLDAIPGVNRGPDGQMRPLGSRLYPEDELRPYLNFLDDSVWEYARSRVLEVHAEGGTLEEGRLMHNMLSSLPMCFNLFGYLRSVPDAALELIQALFDPDAVSIDRIECQWTPGKAVLGDRTAFDAVVMTRRADGSSHLIGVETKYTEPFSDAESSSDRHREVHQGSGWFLPDTADLLAGPATSQLWHDALLAAACAAENVADTASIAVVALADDARARAVTEGLRAALVDPDRCRFVSLESIIDAARALAELSDWADRYDKRYLDLTQLG